MDIFQESSGEYAGRVLSSEKSVCDLAMDVRKVMEVRYAEAARYGRRSWAADQFSEYVPAEETGVQPRRRRLNMVLVTVTSWEMQIAAERSDGRDAKLVLSTANATQMKKKCGVYDEVGVVC